MESKHVLPKKISEDSDFACLNSAIAPDGGKVAYAIISHLYKSNTQIRWKKQLDFYHKVDPTMFWFVNTIGYRQRLILVCSMQASAFTILYPLDCFDNYINKNDWNKDVPVYNIHNITAKQFICYFDFEDGESEEILVEYNWLVLQRPHQALEQTPNNEETICRQMLNNWVLSTWPNFGLDKLKFFLMW